MKRITYAFMSTVTAVVLLFGYRTSTSSHAAGTAATAGPVAGGSTGSTSGSSGSTGTESSSSSASSSGSQTYTGTVAETRWGPVQVRITVSNKKITAVNVIEYPNENPKDQEINSYAIPTLVQETLKAQNAKIDTVSGATVTSDGYLTSLQSALDQAGL